MNFTYGGEPADWIARHGKPARVLGNRGMPSFEDEDGKLLVFELMVVQAPPLTGPMAFPRSYGFVCAVAPEGMAPLHLAGTEGAPHEWWKWRPLVYRWKMDGWWQGLGSQQELTYRFGLCEAQHARYGDGDPALVMQGEDRADRLLVKHLSPQQRLEFVATGDFRVVGARTSNVYRVTPTDGFDLIDAYTGDTVVSYCLHTEYWLPSGDQALAIKLALEDPELEVEVLEGARPYPRDERRRARMSDRLALRLERAHRMLPEPRELVTV